MSNWTETELRRLAINNYFKDNVHDIKLRGEKVGEIVPFGIANVERRFGGVHVPMLQVVDELADPAALGEVFEQELEPGIIGELPDLFADSLDDEFAPIRIGGLAPGGIRGELSARVRREAIEGGFEEQKEEGILQEEKVAEEDDSQELTAIVDAFRLGWGQEINYANHSRLGGHSFGFRRRQFCYDQLRRMRAAFKNIDNIRKYSGYQLAATLSVKKTHQEYFGAAARNFGTTTDDGETRMVPHDANQWPYDIHDPLNDMVVPGTVVVTGNYVAMNSPDMFDAVVEELIRSVDAEIRRQESDSGTLGFNQTSKHLMNIFLYKMLRPVAGSGQYDIDNRAEIIQFSHKSVFTPTRDETRLCFWECLFFFLIRRCIGTGEGEHSHYSRIIHECMNKWRVQGERNGRKLITRFAKKNASRLLSLYAESKKLRADTLAPITLDQIEDVLRYYGCYNPPIILDSEGDALIGDIEGVEKLTLDDGYFTGLLYKEHMHLIISYTGALIVKKCRRCDRRFKTEHTLKKHLEGRSCMTCVCLPKNTYFDTETEWRFHVENKIEVCPRFREDDLIVSTVDERGRKKRFLNDMEENRGQRMKNARDVIEKDDAPFRNHEECIYFDLESVVPLNDFGVANADHKRQQAYACGWLLRSEGLSGGDVNISYGEDCIAEFFTWLDTYYEKLLKDEVMVWYHRAKGGVMVDPIPRKLRGNENYAKRVKASWDRHLANSGTEGCLLCHEPLDVTHGYVYDENGHHTFSNCAYKVYAQNTAENNFVRNFNGNAPRISIWAHNGGRYDWVFIHRYIMESGRMDDIGRCVRSSSKYFMLPYKDIFEFKDSMNFMAGSLDKLGKDFGVETLKGIFPYRLMSKMSRIDMKLENELSIRASIPHEYFQISEKLRGPMGCVIKRDMTEQEYVEFFEERGWVYDVRKETITYLKDDVKCLMQVVEKFRQGWKDMDHSPELFKFMTIGQMCHSYFLDNYLEKNMYPCLDVCEDAYIRRALYGGRTEVFRRIAPPGSKIHYVDVNSLYPFVMESRDLPCGDPIWYLPKDGEAKFEFAPFKMSAFNLRVIEMGEEFFERTKDLLNGGLESERLYGFFEVDVQCNLENRYPILPERRSTDGGKTFKNMFTNMIKRKMVYYSEELKRAIKNGYYVIKVHSFTLWQRGRVYGKLIEVLKEQKLKGEGKDINGERIEGMPTNPSLRAAAKTAQNSLFGKTIQFVDSDVSLVHTREGLFKSLSRAFSKISIKPIFRTAASDVVEVTSKYTVHKVQQRSCAAIGTAILAEARLVLYDYFEMVQEVGGEILYCDTDSIVFAGDTPLGDECMHHCEYGKMKVEIDPDTICPGGFVGMSPKCYAFKLKDGAPYVRCKGVNLGQNLEMVPEERDAMDDLIMEMESEEAIESLGLPIPDGQVVTKGINYDKMRRLITGECDVLVTKQLQFLKTSDRLVSAYENVKMMRSQFDKRLLGDDGITFAWNDFNMNMHKIVAERDNTSLSNYLGVIPPDELHYFRKMYENSDFFQGVVQEWLQSDNVNVLYYNDYISKLDDYVIV